MFLSSFPCNVSKKNNNCSVLNNYHIIGVVFCLSLFELPEKSDASSMKKLFHFEFFRWCALSLCLQHFSESSHIMQQKTLLYLWFWFPHLQELSWPQYFTFAFPDLYLNCFAYSTEKNIAQKKKNLAIGGCSWTYRRETFCMDSL